jgi:hypothetical protein
LNPAKFWVRGEASIKEEAGIMMMSAGNWRIKRKSYISSSVSMNFVCITFELYPMRSQLLNHISCGISCPVVPKSLISLCSPWNIQHLTLWFLY